jgi:hypothetical protein
MLRKETLLLCGVLGAGCSVLVPGPGDRTRGSDAGMRDAGTDAGGPELALTPADHDFGQLLVGLQSEAVVFTARNTGVAATGDLSVRLIGASASSFEITADECTGVALLADETCTVSVAFAPESADPLTVMIEVASGATAATADLSGTGVSSTIAITPMMHEFAVLAEGGTSPEQVFDVQNVGTGSTGTLTVGLAGTDAAAFEITATACEGVSLAELEICTITVVFHASDAGLRSATIEATATSGVGMAQVTGISQGSLADACGDNGHCQSGNCVDGLCCDQPVEMCNGCKACNVAGSEGTCVNLPEGPVEAGRCSEISPCRIDECGTFGNCLLEPAGTVCSDTTTCRNTGAGHRQWLGTVSSEHRCAAGGGCGEVPCPDSRTCDSTTGACRTSCTQDFHCILGTYCSAGNCVPSRTVGGTCSRDAECMQPVGFGQGEGYCVARVCAECGRNVDCSDSFDGRLCRNGNCGPPSNCPAGICLDSGWGNSCEIPVPTVPSIAYCTCTTDAECSHPTAPFCLGGSGGASKACGCVQANGAPCNPRESCVGSGSTARCLLNAGNACVSPGECVSGSCVDERCA